MAMTAMTAIISIIVKPRRRPLIDCAASTSRPDGAS
jgi:hypothetical protein